MPNLQSRRLPRAAPSCGFFLRLPFLLSLLAAASAFAQYPEYWRAALKQFNPQIPKNWAYSLTTERDKLKITERFDPSRAPVEQWMLLLNDDRTPTSDEKEKYFRYKASQKPGAIQANFQKDDIEPGSLKLEREDADRAEFTCTFRELSSSSDKMMGHLQLRLFVNKHLPHVEKYVLTLIAPFSPVLGVKMIELAVTMNFSAPTAGRPSLPTTGTSHFAGRIFFIPTGEDLRYAYTDFKPTAVRE